MRNLVLSAAVLASATFVAMPAPAQEARFTILDVFTSPPECGANMYGHRAVQIDQYYPERNEVRLRPTYVCVSNDRPAAGGMFVAPNGTVYDHIPQGVAREEILQDFLSRRQ